MARAESVRAALIESGVDAGRITVEGVGDSTPLDHSDTPEAHALNRRVAITFQNLPHPPRC